MIEEYTNIDGDDRIIEYPPDFIGYAIFGIMGRLISVKRESRLSLSGMMRNNNMALFRMGEGKYFGMRVKNFNQDFIEKIMFS